MAYIYINSLSLYANKLLAWFGLYNITATDYYAGLPYAALRNRRGLFATVLQELIDAGY